MYLMNVINKALKEHPDMLLGEGLLIVHLGVDVAVVEKVHIDHLNLKSEAKCIVMYSLVYIGTSE